MTATVCSPPQLSQTQDPELAEHRPHQVKFATSSAPIVCYTSHPRQHHEGTAIQTQQVVAQDSNWLPTASFLSYLAHLNNIFFFVSHEPSYTPPTKKDVISVSSPSKGWPLMMMKALCQRQRVLGGQCQSRVSRQYERESGSDGSEQVPEDYISADLRVKNRVKNSLVVLKMV